MTTRKFRLFQYNANCVLRGHVIDKTMAGQRGLIDVNARGAVVRVSDDLFDCGNYTEIGWRRCQPDIAKRYFGR